jgi:hypothetical protein
LIRFELKLNKKKSFKKSKILFWYQIKLKRCLEMNVKNTKELRIIQQTLVFNVNYFIFFTFSFNRLIFFLENDNQGLESRFMRFRRKSGLFNWQKKEKLKAEGYDSRLIDRSREFGQSSGRFRIKRKGTWNRFKVEDWFHSLIHWSTSYIFLLCSLVWIFFCIIFAPLYYLISDKCQMNMHSFQDAYYFSVITFSTVGYSVNDIFFNGCSEAAVLITIQSLLGIMLDTLVLGILFTRIARAQRRAATVLFSEKGVIRQIGKKLYFMFQVCEMRKHQMSEAHVRMYAVRHRTLKNGKKIYFQTHSMRICHPNDELGGMLLLALPSIIVHEIDAWSPLYPFGDEGQVSRNANHGPWNTYRWPEVLRRQGDADAADRSGAVCIACGASFNNSAALRKHIEYAKLDDRCSGHSIMTQCGICGEGYPSESNLLLHRKAAHGYDPESHRDDPIFNKHVSTQEIHSNLAHHIIYSADHSSSQSSDLENNISPSEQPQEGNLYDLKREIDQFLVNERVEIICLVEANDAATSGTMQARHSYTAEDIEFDKMFSPCTMEEENTGAAVIDFRLFHQLEQVDPSGDISEIWTSSHT